MKKKTMIALALALGISSTAFAGPFADVPAKHWSYDAVNKLAAAGIVDGYGDGTYRGDRTITRYEMAQMVAKAMERSDKADAEQKALINKLSAEYADELDNLGVRMSTLEKKVGNITLSGQVRSWYERNEQTNDDTTTTRLLLFMSAPLTEDLTFKGRLWAQSDWGMANNGTTGATIAMDQAYIQGKNFTFGRQGIMLGKGLIYAWFPNNDGATYTVGGDKLKVTAAAFRGENVFLGDASNNINGKHLDHLDIVALDAAYKVNDKLDLTAVYAKNRDENYADGSIIDTWAVGLGYKNGNISFTGEYGENDSDVSNALNGDAAKGWVAQAKVKGADWSKPGTFGVFAGYRDAENGFFGRNGDYIWETGGGSADSLAGYMMNNVKGADYGFEYTVFKNAIFTAQYFDLEKETDGTDKKSATAQLRYFF